MLAVIKFLPSTSVAIVLDLLRLLRVEAPVAPLLRIEIHRLAHLQYGKNSQQEAADKNKPTRWNRRPFQPAASMKTMASGSNLLCSTNECRMEKNIIKTAKEIWTT